MNSIENLITINNYAFYPNIQRIVDEKNNQYDYIALGFEIIFLGDDDTKLQKSVFFTNYLFVDYYEKELNISFEQGRDLTTDQYYQVQVGIGKKPKNKNKQITIQSYDKVFLKKSLFSINTESEDIKNFSDILKNYIQQHIHPSIDHIKTYLNKNNIGYDVKDFDDYIDITKKAINKTFSEIKLNKNFPQNVTMINAQLLSDRLSDNSLSKKPVKKIKI